MLEVRVETNRRQVERWLRQAARDQVPFATARALTEVAREARDAARAHLGRVFELRSRGLPKAIEFQRAEKRDWPHVRAFVYVKDWGAFLAIHERGGIKRGERGHRIAVPTRIVKRTGRGAVRKSQLPSRILARKGSSIDDEGRIRAKTTKRRRAGIFYTLHQRVRVDRRPFLEQPARRAAERSYPGAFQRHLRDAFASRRRR